MEFLLTSTAWVHGDPIPVRYTADGENASPPLKWSTPPDRTASLALVCEDPDAPSKVWVHWIIFNIPNVARELPEGIPNEPVRPNGVMQGKNDFGNLGYGGPAPPLGENHRYFFTLYALDKRLEIPAGATKDRLLSAIRGHILAESQLMGTYSRSA